MVRNFPIQNKVVLASENSCFSFNCSADIAHFPKGTRPISLSPCIRGLYVSLFGGTGSWPRYNHHVNLELILKARPVLSSGKTLAIRSVLVLIKTRRVLFLYFGSLCWSRDFWANTRASTRTSACCAKKQTHDLMHAKRTAKERRSDESWAIKDAFELHHWCDFTHFSSPASP